MAHDRTERVLVTVSGEHRAAIESVAAALRSAGLRVDDIMKTFGIIKGEAAADRLQALESVPGVIAVEPDQEAKAI